MIAQAVALVGAGAVFLLAAVSGGASALGVPGGLSMAIAGPVPAGSLGVAQIGAEAAAAGFRGAGLAMAIAVALAESSGDPAATDYDANGTIDRGLWQINSVHAAYSPACDYDPACAAGAAYAISDAGANWTPWVTYDHGAEIAYLPAATAWVAAQNGSA